MGGDAAPAEPYPNNVIASNRAILTASILGIVLMRFTQSLPFCCPRVLFGAPASYLHATVPCFRHVSICLNVTILTNAYLILLRRGLTVRAPKMVWPGFPADKAPAISWTGAHTLERPGLYERGVVAVKKVTIAQTFGCVFSPRVLSDGCVLGFHKYLTSLIALRKRSV